MKRISICLVLILTTITLSAQSVLSFGVRGGWDFLMPKTEQKAQEKFGAAGAFDVGYTYYVPTKNGDWGIHTGLSAGYVQNSMQLDFAEQYTHYDYLNNEMLYTTSGALDTKLQRAFMEVPVMAAVRYNGFIAQFGLKAQFSVWSQSEQQLKKTNIDAYYVPFDVHVTNELVTGVVLSGDLEKQHYSGVAPLFNLLLSAQIGYEFKIDDRNKLGICAYVDYNVWNTKSSAANPRPLIDVAPISDMSNPVPNVTVNDAFSNIITGMQPLQVGIYVYYGLEFEKK